MTIRAAGPIAASLAAVAAAASPAFAQTNRPWVDPPKELAAPAQKPAGADPRPAPVAATPADSDLGKEKPAAAKTEPPKADPVKVEAAKPEPVKVEAPKPVPVREAAQTNQRPRPKKVVSAPAPRPAKVAARPQPSPRVAQRRNVPAQRTQPRGPAPATARAEPTRNAEQSQLRGKSLSSSGSVDDTGERRETRDV
jgi:hypothetical protein